MKNTEFMCLVIMPRFLEIKADTKIRETSFSEINDFNLKIKRVIKRLGLKERLSVFRKKSLSKNIVPIISKIKDREYILTLGIREDGCLVLDPKEKKLITYHQRKRMIR